MDKEREIMLKVEKMLTDMGYYVAYIGLYGSNNYGLATASSDYDYKVLVVPKLDDIVYNRKPTSTTLPHEWNGQVDVKDVRLMIDQWKKGSPNFMELLFTEWYDIPDPLFKSYFEDLRARREEIAHANPKSSLKAMYGMMMEKFHALDHPYPCQAEEIEKHHYASKQLHHLMRMGAMIMNYDQESYYTITNPFSDNSDHSSWLRELFTIAKEVKTREREYNSLEEAQKVGQAWLDAAKPIVDVVPEGFSQETYNFLDETKAKVLKAAFRAELKES